MQVLYDTETEHSVNKINQQKWNKKIADGIKSLSAFSATDISCKLIQ